MKLVPVLAFVFACGCLDRPPTEPRPKQKAPPSSAAEDPREENRSDVSPRTTGAPPWRLVRVVDGDTIIAVGRGEKERVRLLRIDTPERGEPGHKEATRALAGLIEGKRLTLEDEIPGSPERDQYGRLLAYVFADGRLVNAEMIRLGWSKFEAGFGRGRYAEELIAAGREPVRRDEQ